MWYAAEYLSCGTFAAIPMGNFPLMFIYCILYHFWDVRRILLPPQRQFRTPLATASRLDPRSRGICGLSNHLSSFRSQFRPSIVQTFSSPSFLSQCFPLHVSRPYISPLPSFPHHHPAANVSDPFLQDAQLCALSICAIILLPFMQSYFLLSLKCIPQEIHKR